MALTAPYMHDGSLATLRDVVHFYDRGGLANDGLDPRVRPLALSSREIDDLVAFLTSLTGRDVGVLVADAFAAPIGDTIFYTMTASGNTLSFSVGSVLGVVS